MESYQQSKLVGIPANVVQNVFPNKNGEKFGFSVENLNEKFINGVYIDLEISLIALHFTQYASIFFYDLLIVPILAKKL